MKSRKPRLSDINERHIKLHAPDKSIESLQSCSLYLVITSLQKIKNKTFIDSNNGSKIPPPSIKIIIKPTNKPKNNN